jgi:hypothetical protein
LVIVDETINIICGYCPHPRAPGALALSLNRERDLIEALQIIVRVPVLLELLFGHSRA